MTIPWSPSSPSQDQTPPRQSATGAGQARSPPLRLERSHRQSHCGRLHAHRERPGAPRTAPTRPTRSGRTRPPPTRSPRRLVNAMVGPVDRATEPARRAFRAPASRIGAAPRLPEPPTDCGPRRGRLLTSPPHSVVAVRRPLLRWQPARSATPAQVSEWVALWPWLTACSRPPRSGGDCETAPPAPPTTPVETKDCSLRLPSSGLRPRLFERPGGSAGHSPVAGGEPR